MQSLYSTAPADWTVNIQYTLGNTYKKKKNTCRGQRFPRTINSNGTFTDTNPGIKKNPNPIKTITTIKAKKTALTTIRTLKMTIKSKIRVEQSYEKIKSKILNSLADIFIIYIYIYI